MGRIQISQPKTGELEWNALKDPLETGWITQGPNVSKFEKIFAERHEVKHSIACSNCTTGLHLILAGLGIGPGDEVIVPAFTWVASANVVVYCGATPVFVDVDEKSYNLDPKKLEGAITAKTKAIMAVHLFGLPADIDAISDVCKDIPIVEDAACAAGAIYKGRSSGTLGVAASYSFHPRKIITTGEGGMVTTNHTELFEKMAAMRNHGAAVSEEQRHHGPQPYILPDFNLLGFNYRMTDLQGAVGVQQMSRLDGLLKQRQEYADFYKSALSDISWLQVPQSGFNEDYKHSWQAYVCYVDPGSAPKPRNEIMADLHEKGVSTRPGTHAVTTLGYYTSKHGINPADFPVAQRLQEQTMAIPLHNCMSQDDVERVVEELHLIQ